MIPIPASLLEWTLSISFLLLIVSLIITFIRFLKGPDLPDRIIAFDLIVIIMMGIMVIYSMVADQVVLLDAVVIMALISFLGTVAYARYLEKGARS